MKIDFFFSKSKRAIITSLCVMFTVMANAYDANIDGIYYNLSEETKAATVTSSGSSKYKYSGFVQIPQEVVYKGITYTVNKIGYDAFHGSYDLKSVSIPNTVTYIGNGAF